MHFRVAGNLRFFVTLRHHPSLSTIWSECENRMDNNTRHEFSPNAFQIWMGQWRLTTLDTEGCMFVLRFLLRAFRSRQSDDRFWRFLERFLFSDDDDNSVYADYVRTSKNLLGQAATLAPEQARALIAYLAECYATESDRLFWNTVSEAVQLYSVAPYNGRAAGTA